MLSKLNSVSFGETRGHLALEDGTPVLILNRTRNPKGQFVGFYTQVNGTNVSVKATVLFADGSEEDFDVSTWGECFKDYARRQMAEHAEVESKKAKAALRHLKAQENRQKRLANLALPKDWLEFRRNAHKRWSIACVGKSRSQIEDEILVAQYGLVA